jgi:Ca2+/Na+ antiporter
MTFFANICIVTAFALFALFKLRSQEGSTWRDLCIWMLSFLPFAFVHDFSFVLMVLTCTLCLLIILLVNWRRDNSKVQKP